jgi:hypothetical protein
MAPSRVGIGDPQSIRRNVSPAYYSDNTFMIHDPSWALRWLEQIGRDNVKHLAKLRIFVYAPYHLGPYPDLYDRPPTG